MGLKIKSVLFGAVGILITIAAPSQASFYGYTSVLQRLPTDLEIRVPLTDTQTYGMNCILGMATCRPQKVSLFSAPKALRPELERIPLATPDVGPMAHTIFCMKYAQDCEVKGYAFRGHKQNLTIDRWRELQEVNLAVNRSIRPEHNDLGVFAEKWIISPVSGDCNDYAVTKRHELLARGWPSYSLLLAEVITHWGEHHLVLVVRSSQGDFVLDSLTGSIRPWSKVPYRWVRMQTQRNPKMWVTVATVSA